MRAGKRPTTASSGLYALYNKLTPRGARALAARPVPPKKRKRPAKKA